MSRFAVLCSGLLKEMKLPCSGNQNKTGFLNPKRNHEYVNGAPDALLRCARCNVDFQNMDRLPMIKETHSELCTNLTCVVSDIISNDEESMVQLEEVVAAAEQAQRNARGYSTDYINKRQHMALDSLTHFMEGHNQLLRQLSQGPSRDDLVYQMKRTVQRLLSDCHGRATSRKTNEVVSLIVNRKEHDKTAAECMKSNQTKVLPTSQFMHEAFGDDAYRKPMARLVVSNDKDTIIAAPTPSQSQNIS
jgi:hypothetical protein